MPTSKTYLPDVNVWLALSSRRHIHNQKAAVWLQNMGQDGIAFCRVTQMGLLRLLTNPKAMGIDVVSQAQAWKVYDQICEDSHVTFLGEPSGLPEAWRSLTQQDKPAPKAW